MLLLGRAQKLFRTRSDARNIDSDQARLRPVAEAIESAIKIAEAERIGLNRRLEDALARAAVTFGNGTDEYLERDAADNKLQDLLSTEIKNGERRLIELETQIGHLKFLHTAMTTRFPGLKLTPSGLPK
ncbi:hypothetical protein [Nitrobacter winogradskyi]|uniref:Uncharacterized protein n=3 Tax=Nitrobacter winogradskyi TaxID=913 RepID=A0A4Y3WD23_NITWI|nr:hypothetical protein [Nitrobacter winogradskyi]GEC16814.1 hypothetical protein NWI01_27060 [Nitrobacter winogradskyi]